ncbi:hypothetical protein G7046_g896 [Stylonectria norvegica]|nr:hypothetical protein G7046_g896 [Stylonectria norvegica]
MASAGLDTMITVKVTFEGTARRTKMPLRDMVPKTLEANIRTFLHIPANTDTIFERYSDSAGAYVQLVYGNINVYKQLYRAAKAKSKLKIRVTALEPQKAIPKPVTVEDEPETVSSVLTTDVLSETTPEEKPQDKPEEMADNSSPVPAPAVEIAETTPASTQTQAPPVPPKTPLPYRTLPTFKTYDSALLNDAAKYVSERSDVRRDFEDRIASLMDRHSGLATRIATQQRDNRGLLAQQEFNSRTPVNSIQNQWGISIPAPPLPAVACPAVCPTAGVSFAVCCNSCEKTIPDSHYHCSTCDDGDFDLCRACVERGITCHGKDHWLIKRSTMDGQIVQSLTERITPRAKVPKTEPTEAKAEVNAVNNVAPKIEAMPWSHTNIDSWPKIEYRDGVPTLLRGSKEPSTWSASLRTCNCCVQELPEREFLHCTTCEDFDLCQPCFSKDGHGHHPQHAFVAAVNGTEVPSHIKAKMSAGRNQVHHAICDGCDKYITGIRHKCLDCPDWDYCSSCYQNSPYIHPEHRFVPIYEQLTDIRVRTSHAVHVGICCDGPLCSESLAYPAYIRGIRYKCAVCNDLDFCANCEASPANKHNKTHPLIKFKTPVRHVSITTVGEHQDGHQLPTMGDRCTRHAKSNEATSSTRGNSMNAVQTVVDVKPVEMAGVKAVEHSTKTLEPENIQEKKELSTPAPAEKPVTEQELEAVYVRDTIRDGTILPPNQVFEQTWTLRNTSAVSWPAGCSLKFVGGDYMGHVDSNHPARISELVSASESTVCYAPLAPGQEFQFTVLLRTPARAGKLISYWRLTAPDGLKFGHRLWCEVNVRMVKSDPKPVASPVEQVAVEEPKAEIEEEVEEEIKEEAKDSETSVASSQMIFPKLETESPVSSIHEATQAKAKPEPIIADEPQGESDHYENAEDLEDDEWDASDDGFMTDEEYDILDASDEEFLEEQKKLATKALSAASWKEGRKCIHIHIHTKNNVLHFRVVTKGDGARCDRSPIFAASSNPFASFRRSRPRLQRCCLLAAPAVDLLQLPRLRRLPASTTRREPAHSATSTGFLIRQRLRVSPTIDCSLDMGTFSLPGDNDAAEAGRATPRPRPPLPFAKRAYVSSPFNSKRTGTPQTSSARKLLTARDDLHASSLNRNSIATARNIFRQSTISDSPPVAPFSPSLPQSTMKKVFAPGATPEPSRVFRGSTAQPTPRGMAAKATSKDLFPMRIEDPDPELSGEAITRKIPKDWNSKGSIYADEFLAQFCPPDLDDEQRRQFFCILDLRRLKYAANEIFAKKDWKLNVVNFAKEFEKSRSIILLRYGLYEFQTVKPSKEVLRRWRRDHGLPEPEETEVEVSELTPTKPTATKKRKADDELSSDAAPVNAFANKNKRRAPEVEDEEEKEEVTRTITPALNNNKRKAVSDVPESQPSKMQKSTSSAAKSLFEKIANKSTTTPVGSPAKAVFKPADERSATKPNPFTAGKTNGGGLARSMFQNLQPKPSTTQPSSGGNNIFGYLSDGSSAKNSGVEADAESETDSEPEESQEAAQSDEPSVGASSIETASQVGSGLFASKPTATTGLSAVTSSTPGTREGTPARSLFDRVTKDSVGQPVRAESPAEITSSGTPAPVDQTWNPTTTPIKFAPSAPSTQSGSLFGAPTTTPSSSVFAPKSTTASNVFGAPKQDKPAEKESTPAAEEADKTGGESDKENDSQTAKKPVFEPKAATPAPSLGSSLFQPQPASESSKDAEPAKATPSLFGAAFKSDSSTASSASTMFGSVSKPAESAPAPTSAVMQSSTLFGSATTEPEKPRAEDTPKPASLFGASSSQPTSTDAAAPNPLFGAKPAGNTTNIFGGASLTPTTTSSIFGASSSSKVDAPPATTQSTAAPIFSFGVTPGGDKANGASATPVFGAPKSPSSGVAANSLFGGSPMKQDGPSPAKKSFNGGGSDTPSSSAIFSGFSNTQSTNSSSVFGKPSAATANGTSSANSSFGATPAANTGSQFSFGGASAGSSFNNPFSSTNGGDSGSAPAPSSSGMFNFGATAAPAATGGSPFQFGGGNASTAAPSFGSTAAPSFGSNQASTSFTSTFGNASNNNGTPGLNFTAASPQPPQAGTVFGSGQPAPAFANLLPPAGGASTTGTNSPFSLGGSSLATTPAGGTPEPSGQAGGAVGGEIEEGEKHEQINLTEGVEADEDVLHDVRAKVLKFVPAGEKEDSEDKAKSKSPWSTQGIGPLRLLKHKETSLVRLLLRAEPRGHVAMNRAVLADMSYKADGKYVKMTTSNEKGNGLETWMVQVKTKELAAQLAEALEKHKKLNKK